MDHDVLVGWFAVFIRKEEQRIKLTVVLKDEFQFPIQNGSHIPEN